MKKNGLKVHAIDLGSRFVTHGNINDLYKLCGLDPMGIVMRVQEALKDEEAP